jgi:GNAT superfamily N-acetyltransferase
VSQKTEIRPLRLNERADWEPLWKGYLDFYNTSVSKETYDTTWARLHDPNEPMWLLGATVDGKLLGIVHYLYHRSCWTIGDYCYLQDLFVAKDARGRGLGRALIEAVYKAAQETGASRVHWLTHETNATARALYDQLAAAPGFIQYRKLF